MPLLTSKNIWCPCLPHRLICNTFCRCFHLTNMARVNNLHFLLFVFVFIAFFSLLLFILVIYSPFLFYVCRSIGSVVKKKYEVSTVCSSLPPLPFFIFFFLVHRPGCCNTSETSQISCVLPWKTKKDNFYKNNWKHLHTSRLFSTLRNSCAK